MGETLKNNSKLNVFVHFLGIFNRGTLVKLLLGKWPCMAIWKTKMLFWLHKNCNWFLKWAEWKAWCSVESSFAAVGCVQCCIGGCHLPFTRAEWRWRVQGGELDLQALLCAVLENLGCWYVRQWACKIGYRQHRRRVLGNTALNR